MRTSERQNGERRCTGPGKQKALKDTSAKNPGHGRGARQLCCQDKAKYWERQSPKPAEPQYLRHREQFAAMVYQHAHRGEPLQWRVGALGQRGGDVHGISSAMCGMLLGAHQLRRFKRLFSGYSASQYRYFVLLRAGPLPSESTPMDQGGRRAVLIGTPSRPSSHPERPRGVASPSFLYERLLLVGLKQTCWTPGRGQRFSGRN